MILYHGSYQEIQSPNIVFSRTNLDFGQGFYTTPIKQQAINWAKRFSQLGKSSVLNIYEFDENLFKTFNTKEFYSYNEEWLDFIIANRKNKDVNYHDIIIGGVANDKVFDTIELFLEGLIDRKTALGKLIYKEINSQICFRNQAILDNHLIFKGCEIL